MSEKMQDKQYTFEDCRRIVDTLRSEEGCPWDRAQTKESLKPFMIEEMVEAAAAVNTNDMENLCEELGDQLLLILLQCSIARENGSFSLDDVILNYIALNIKSNIRELEGALNKLVAYENLVQTEITMEIAEKELQNIISPDIPLEVTPQLVVEVVAEHFGITMDQITSKSRSNDVAKPRQIAMYLCKNMTDASLETIGKAVGGRDHSTVVHGIKKVGDDISTDTSVERLVATIRKKINPH